MPSRSGPVHVAKITRKTHGKTYVSYLLRRTFRQGDQVKHETLGNLSHLPTAVIDAVRRMLRGEVLVGLRDRFRILRARPHGHVAAVLGTLRHLGLEQLLGSRRSRQRDLVAGMIVGRLLNPGSKLATTRRWSQNTLGESLGVESAEVDELYLAMDWLLARQRRIEIALAKRHLSEGSLVLYDVTSTYFEGRHCALARLGYSRDDKPGKLQIVIGLLTNGAGCPVAVEVFEGHTGDPKTLGVQITKVRQRFGLQRVILVGDRGMITSARIEEDLRPAASIDWITALRAPQIQALRERGSLQLGLFDERDLAEISDPAYPGERLIVCRNPWLAAERARKRQELLADTEMKLAPIAAATTRVQRPLRGKARIGLRVGRVLGRSKVGKHFRLEITEERFSFERDREGIAQEAALDGIYVVRTSVPPERLTAEDAVRSYKRLSAVEQAFRSLKTIELEIRPIFHRLADRVRAHVFLCMLAYYVEWHMRRALAPLLFDDPQPQLRPGSPVAPARRSAAAEAKAHRQRLEDGTPVHSFRTLLEELATLTKNRLQLKDAESAEFDELTEPTPLQRRAFELLGVPINL